MSLSDHSRSGIQPWSQSCWFVCTYCYSHSLPSLRTWIQIIWWIQYVIADQDTFGSWGKSIARCIRELQRKYPEQENHDTKFPQYWRKSETFWGIYSAKIFPDFKMILPEKVVWLSEMGSTPKCGYFKCK